MLLHWIPLGAGGNGFVRRNGLVYEWCVARMQRREPLALLHAALTVETSGASYVIEQGWPVPDANGAARGVTVTGPVGFRGADRWRALRYEVRCWEGGVIADLEDAVVPPVTVASGDDAVARLMAASSRVPAVTWGRKPPDCAEMWNSNSALAWVLVTAGVDMEGIAVPPGCRAPGWSTGMAVAARG